MEEITNYRMIYAGTYSLDNKKDRHAFAVYGYTKDKWYYSWNPWGEELISSMDSDIIKAGNGERFYWDSSIRNFTWK